MTRPPTANGTTDRSQPTAHQDGQTAMDLSRRRVLQAGVAGGLALASFSGTASASATTEPGDVLWSYEGLNSHRASVTVVDDIVYVPSSDGFKTVEADTGELYWDTLVSTYNAATSVTDGMVYTRETPSGKVLAFETDPEDPSSSPDPVWEFEPPTDSNGESPTVANDMVYFGDQEGNVYALDAATGNEAWTYEGHSHSTENTPTVVDGVLYIGAGTSGTPGGGLYALDADTGDEEWIFGDEDLEWEIKPPTVADGTVYAVGTFGGAGGTARRWAFDAEDGTELWSHATRQMNLGVPTVYNGRVYCHADGLRAWDADTGELDWRRTGDAATDPTVADGTVYVVDRDGEITAADAETGELVWRTTPDEFDDRISNQMNTIVVNGTLFVGTESVTAGGALYAIDAGVDGHSEDSLVRYGTFGHHHSWAGTDAPTEPYERVDGSESDADGDTEADADGDTEADTEDDPTDDSDSGESTDDEAPGFGFGTALAGISGAGYVLYNRLTDESTEQH